MIENIIVLGLLVILILVLFLIFVKVIPLYKKKVELSEREIKNDLYRIYMSIDPDVVQQTIDSMIDQKIQEYILYRIRTRDAQFISSKDSDNIVSTVTESIYIELSELYLFYIKLMRNIETDDDLLSYINNRVKYRAILIISENNKTT